MDTKLQSLYEECKLELKNIGINLDNNLVGNITVDISKRNCKRYGCCKQEDPVPSSKYYERIGRKKYAKYSLYKTHKIEISKWVMDLNDDIIKNTIIHEIIHCFPNCSNHGEEFKKYANYINKQLGYNISRLGNKNKDLEDSNIEIEKEKFNYKVECSKCGYIFYRKRITSSFTHRYRCGKCRGIFTAQKGVFYL